MDVFFSSSSRVNESIEKKPTKSIKAKSTHGEELKKALTDGKKFEKGRTERFAKP